MLYEVITIICAQRGSGLRHVHDGIGKDGRLDLGRAPGKFDARINAVL